MRRIMSRKKSVRSGLIFGILLGSIVSGWMWYLLNDRETENLMTRQSPKYQAQLSLQKFREAGAKNDTMGQLFHLESAVKHLADANRRTADDQNLLIQYHNASLQLARIRQELHQYDEARGIRKRVLEQVHTTLQSNSTEEAIRELALAAFLDWARTPQGNASEIATKGNALSKTMMTGFELVTPLDQTRLATAELHYVTLENLGKTDTLKKQLALVDIALRSLMDGIRAATQPLLYAAQVQKFINSAKRIAKKSGQSEVQAHFRQLNLDWRRRRIQLSPNDVLAKLHLAQALIDTMHAQDRLDQKGMAEVVDIFENIKTDTLKVEEVRRLFFVQSAYAAYLSKRKQIDPSLVYYQKALALARRSSESHPKELVTALRNLAVLSKRANKLSESKRLFSEAFTTVDACVDSEKCAPALWLRTYYRALKSDGLAASGSEGKLRVLKARNLHRKLSAEEKKTFAGALKGIRQLGGM